MEEIIQLKLTLKWSKPPIWRRVLVERDRTFSDLHLVVQGVMGWENAHLYEFKVGGYRVGEPDEDFGDLGFGDDKVVEASEVRLDSVLTGAKDRFQYEYDFGDGWVHDVLVEKTLPRATGMVYPCCTGGALNRPPEDCGGMGGYIELLKAQADKRHPQHAWMLEWLGGRPWDAERFDLAAANERLRVLAR